MQRGLCFLKTPRPRLTVHDVPVESEARRRPPRNDAGFNKRDTMSDQEFFRPRNLRCAARAHAVRHVMFKIAAQRVSSPR
jgi:hypothetical protein